MKRLAGFVGFLVMAAALGLFTGCSTNGTVTSRKQERYSAYSALSPEMRSLVDQGRITVGMSSDAVFIAWGSPDKITEGETSSGKTATWSYYGTYLETINTWGWRRTYYSSYPVNYIRAQATFTNNVVKEWQTFPAPGY